jgi:ribonucleotide monophosphatase NagD (HAD superfamily)
MSDPTMWEENLQIICDLLISKDGIPGSVRSPEEPQFVKLYMTNLDFLYADNFVLPRHAQGCFLICLEELYKRQYHRSIDTIVYGKPTAHTFQYAGSVSCES